MYLAGARGWHTLARRHSHYLPLHDAIGKGATCRRYAAPASFGTGTLIKPPIHGQPLAKTHPHLIAPHELTPGIPTTEYEDRRTRLMDSLPEGSLVVRVTSKINTSS